MYPEIKRISCGIAVYLVSIKDVFNFSVGKILPKNYEVLPPVLLIDNPNLFWLNDAELSRFNSFKTMKKQAEWLAGRYCLKFSLKNYFFKSDAFDFQACEVEYRQEGAPFLNSYPDLNFSISHSGNYSAVVYSGVANEIVGLDIEKIVPKNISAIASIGFTNEELYRIKKDGLDNNYDLELFLKIWTAKEAFLKYIGRGFHEPLKNISVLNDSISYKNQPVDIKMFTVKYDKHVITLVIGIDHECQKIKKKF